MSSAAQVCAKTAVSVTPSDTEENKFDALYIGGLGDVECIPAGQDEVVVFTGVDVGWFPVSVKKVYDTNTTATNIIGVTW